MLTKKTQSMTDEFISKELKKDIENHFKYFWDNNRSATLNE